MRKTQLLIFTVIFSLLSVNVVMAKTEVKMPREEFNAKVKKEIKDKKQKIKDDPDFEILYEYDDGNFTYGVSKNVMTKEDKKRILAKIDKLKAQDYSDNIADTGKTYEGSDYVRATFNSNFNVHDPLLSNYVVTVAGESDGFWTGDNPFYAEEIHSYDEFTFSGIGITVSVPLGLSVSGTSKSKTVTWPVFKNRYDYTNIYSDIEAEGTTITKFAQTHSNIFKLGNRNINANATDSATIW